MMQMTLMDKGQMGADDVDDLTQSSDTPTEHYGLPPLNCKDALLLLEQLSVDCKDPISLLKIEDALLSYDASVERKKEHCTLLTGKVKSLENQITGLQGELSKTREIKTQLEHQKAECDRELHSLRFALKQEEVKRMTAEMLFEKNREQLRRKEEQCSQEMELKQQLEFTLRTLDLELRTVRNHLKQVEEERNDTQRLLSQEQNVTALQARILNNPLWKQKVPEASTSKMTQTSELHTEREKLKKLMDLNQFLENRLKQEIKRNGELEKDLSGFKKLLKTTKKKLKEHEKGNVYKGEVKQTDPEITREINRLKNKIEELTEQLETVSTKWKQSESINRSLQEELLSAKILQKKYDKMQENERQLKEEVVNLRHHLEITKTQAAAQGELEQLRENNSASMRNLMEQKIRYLESKMKNSRGEAWKTELEGYRQLLSEELKARKSLSNRLDRTTERLNDLSCQLLKEQQKKKILIASCATSPAQEPSYIGNVNTSMFLSRNLFPRGDLEYSPGDPVSSESTVEAYFSKMQQELEESITRELNEVTDKIESRP